MAKKSKGKSLWSKIWFFLWKDESWASLIVDILIAFVLIKFLVYPGLGLVFGTDLPIVAVVSNSMSHSDGFDEWWLKNEDFYLSKNITKSDFEQFPFLNGFDRGDIMILYGSKLENVELGDVIVFDSLKPYPIIHRVIKILPDEGTVFFRTKGDNNKVIIRTYELNEWKINPTFYHGTAVLRIPYLGYIKILFVELLQKLGVYNLVAGTALG